MNTKNTKGIRKGDIVRIQTQVCPPKFKTVRIIEDGVICDKYSVLFREKSGAIGHAKVEDMHLMLDVEIQKEHDWKIKKHPEKMTLLQAQKHFNCATLVEESYRSRWSSIRKIRVEYSGDHECGKYDV